MFISHFFLCPCIFVILLCFAAKFLLLVINHIRALPDFISLRAEHLEKLRFSHCPFPPSGQSTSKNFVFLTALFLPTGRAPRKTLFFSLPFSSLRAEHLEKLRFSRCPFPPYGQSTSKNFVFLGRFARQIVRNTPTHASMVGFVFDDLALPFSHYIIFFCIIPVYLRILWSLI